MSHALSDQIRLTRSFYNRSTKVVARELIGCALRHRIDGQWVGGWIVETEAYLSARDPASHSSRGRTPSNDSMFRDPGTLYVYPIHAKHCLNAVTEANGDGAAVLIRAIEPIWGTETMMRLRGYEDRKRLTSGPAMLCQALAVDRTDDGRCLIRDDALGLFRVPTTNPRRVVATKRIGISKAKHRNLRFVDADSPFLSRPIHKGAMPV